MRPSELEYGVFVLEEVRIVVRAEPKGEVSINLCRVARRCEFFARFQQRRDSSFLISCNAKDTSARRLKIYRTRFCGLQMSDLSFHVAPAVEKALYAIVEDFGSLGSTTFVKGAPSSCCRAIVASTERPLRHSSPSSYLAHFSTAQVQNTPHSGLATVSAFLLCAAKAC
jgi:hypothetical protein